MKLSQLPDLPSILYLCPHSDEALPDEREFEVLAEEAVKGEIIF